MEKLKALISDFSQASRQSGRSLSTLFLEALRLRFGQGKLGLSDYLDFRLHMGALTLEEKRAFGSYRAEAILEEILIDDYARFLSLDKITMYTLLEGYGLPIPKFHAVYRTHRPGTLKCLQTPSELADYLKQENSLPVYVKPSFGGYGRGNTMIAGLEGESLRLGNGQQIGLMDFCESLDDRGGLGWMLQEPLAAESSIAERCGSKISGVRVHSFLGASGPTIMKAIWKINVGKDDSDNFCDGESGNLAAALDVETGEVIRVISGIGLGQRVNVPHPITGAQLVGFKLPGWDRIRELVCEAQLAFPGFLCPGWDIAVCEDGPKILEINFFGDIDLPQRAYGTGFMDETFLALMRDNGLDTLLSGSSKLKARSSVNGRFGRRKHHWRW